MSSSRGYDYELLGWNHRLGALAAERTDLRLPYDRPLPHHALFADPRPFPAAERVCRSAIGFRVDPNLGAREMDATIWAVRRALAWAGHSVGNTPADAPAPSVARDPAR